MDGPGRRSRAGRGPGRFRAGWGQGSHRRRQTRDHGDDHRRRGQRSDPRNDVGSEMVDRRGGSFRRRRFSPSVGHPQRYCSAQGRSRVDLPSLDALDASSRSSASGGDLLRNSMGMPLPALCRRPLPRLQMTALRPLAPTNPSPRPACWQPVGLEGFSTSNVLILFRFVFLGKDEKPNDINECTFKSDRLLAGAELAASPVSLT